ncbi:MAG: diaminopimelate decarboxylase [Gammaproteobacteria bacterium RIFCSPLOWO2_02_FULL_61_13]|nr:MAG: diaminopimelate decarboxylase [Gammaproteobacteria bacterium RIFCSPLOWO2_02_FULL_61_13]
MTEYPYRDRILHMESVSLADVASRFGTPCYVYSRAAIERQWHAFDAAFGKRTHLVCYAVKANSTLGVLQVLARLGSGFDIVSVGELERVIAAGGAPARTVFSGVGKRADEMRRALEAGIRCFNVESESELRRLDKVAGSLGKIAPVALRVNPDVDPGTHPYISTGLRENKFGIAREEALRIYHEAGRLAHVRVTGVACHVGSQIVTLAPFQDTAARMAELVRELKRDGLVVDHADLGGGLGVRHAAEQPPEPAILVQALCDAFAGMEVELHVEPGRAIVANAGMLLTRVEYLKQNGMKHFAVVDAAMNDLLRPALYQSWHDIVPVQAGGGAPERCYDVVGPVCESADFLGLNRPLAIAEGDLLAVRSVGAYGATMASNYNSRSRPAEVLVDGAQTWEIRRREALTDLWASEKLVQ